MGPKLQGYIMGQKEWRCTYVCMCVKCTHVRYLKFFTCLLFSDRLYGCKRDEEEREKYAIEAVLETGLHLAWTVRAWGRQYQRV